jgi:ElaB protein
MESVLNSPTAHSAADFANGQVSGFLDSVEDLTKALKDIDTPDIARLRAKVKIALVAAKSAASDTATQIRSQAQQVGERADNFVRENPWQVIGIAAVVGLALGLLASRRSS